jgi:hypothetical protein
MGKIKSTWRRVLPRLKIKEESAPLRKNRAGFVYGYDRILRLGWRAPAEEPQLKVFAKPIEIKKADHDTDKLTIKFDDGDTATLSEVTVGLFKVQHRQGSQPASTPPWSGETKETHHKLTISQRTLSVTHWQHFSVFLLPRKSVEDSNSFFIVSAALYSSFYFRIFWRYASAMPKR